MIEHKIFIPVWNANIILIGGDRQTVLDYFEEKHEGIDLDKYVGSEGNHFTIVNNKENKKYDYLV